MFLRHPLRVVLDVLLEFRVAQSKLALISLSLRVST